MKLWEAIKLLESGSKVRKGNWPKGVYMHFVPDSYDGKSTLEVVGSRCFTLKAYNFRYYLGENWEIF